MKYTNGSQEIDVSKGAYNSIYKQQGYIEVESPLQEDNSKGEVQLEKLTVKALRLIARSRGLYNSDGMNKSELIAYIESIVSNEDKQGSDGSGTSEY